MCLFYLVLSALSTGLEAFAVASANAAGEAFVWSFMRELGKLAIGRWGVLQYFSGMWAGPAPDLIPPPTKISSSFIDLTDVRRLLFY